MKKTSQRVIKLSSPQRGNIFLPIILFLVLFILSAGCAKRDIKNMDSKGSNIICFGDSITFGYGVEKGEDYPSFLGKIVNIPVINAGVDGDSSTEGLKRLDSDVLNKKPLLVIIEFGGNDFLLKIPIDVTLKNMEEMVESIQAAGAMAALVDISTGFVLNDYRGKIIKLAKQKKAIFIPGILNGIITNPRLKSDFLHPNELGYDIIAHKVYRAIKPYLKKTKL